VYQSKEAHLKAKFRLQGLQGKASVKRISHVSKYYFVQANLMQRDPDNHYHGIGLFTWNQTLATNLTQTPNNTTSTGVRETWS
jgi:hypothetical protein